MPGKNRSTVIFRLVTISASSSTSAVSCSVGKAGFSGSSTGICLCSLRARETRSADSSLIGMRSSAVV